MELTEIGQLKYITFVGIQSQILFMLKACLLVLC